LISTVTKLTLYTLYCQALTKPGKAKPKHRRAGWRNREGCRLRQEEGSRLPLSHFSWCGAILGIELRALHF
jgi:hypothetical protein